MDEMREGVLVTQRATAFNSIFFPKLKDTDLLGREHM